MAKEQVNHTSRVCKVVEEGKKQKQNRNHKCDQTYDNIFNQENVAN